MRFGNIPSYAGRKLSALGGGIKWLMWGGVKRRVLSILGAGTIAGSLTTETGRGVRDQVIGVLDGMVENAQHGYDLPVPINILDAASPNYIVAEEVRLMLESVSRDLQLDEDIYREHRAGFAKIAARAEELYRDEGVDVSPDWLELSVDCSELVDAVRMDTQLADFLRDEVFAERSLPEIEKYLDQTDEMIDEADDEMFSSTDVADKLDAGDMKLLDIDSDGTIDGVNVVGVLSKGDWKDFVSRLKEDAADTASLDILDGLITCSNPQEKARLIQILTSDVEEIFESGLFDGAADVADIVGENGRSAVTLFGLDTLEGFKNRNIVGSFVPSTFSFLRQNVFTYMRGTFDINHGLILAVALAFAGRKGGQFARNRIKKSRNAVNDISIGRAQERIVAMRKYMSHLDKMLEDLEKPGVYKERTRVMLEPFGPVTPTASGFDVDDSGWSDEVRPLVKRQIEEIEADQEQVKIQHEGVVDGAKGGLLDDGAFEKNLKVSDKVTFLQNIALLRGKKKRMEIALNHLETEVQSGSITSEDYLMERLSFIKNGTALIFISDGAWLARAGVTGLNLLNYVQNGFQLAARFVDGRTLNASDADKQGTLDIVEEYGYVPFDMALPGSVDPDSGQSIGSKQISVQLENRDARILQEIKGLYGTLRITEDLAAVMGGRGDIQKEIEEIKKVLKDSKTDPNFMTETMNVNPGTSSVLEALEGLSPDVFSDNPLLVGLRTLASLSFESSKPAETSVYTERAGVEAEWRRKSQEYLDKAQQLLKDIPEEAGKDVGEFARFLKMSMRSQIAQLIHLYRDTRGLAQHQIKSSDSDIQIQETIWGIIEQIKRTTS